MSDPEGDGGSMDAPPTNANLQEITTDIVQRHRYLIVAVAVVISMVLALVHFTGQPESTVSASAAGATESGPTTAVQPVGPLRVYGGYGPFAAKVTGPDEIISTSLSTFYNATTNPVDITNFEPIDAEGVELVGVKFAFDGSGFAAYVNGTGFPDPAALKSADTKIFELSDVNPIKPVGREISDNAPEDALLWAIVGMRLQPGLKSGSLAGVALNYTDGAATHRLELIGARKLCIAEGCA